MTADSTPNKSSLRIRILAIGIVVLITGLLLECCCRLLFPAPEVNNFNRVYYSPADVAAGLSEQPALRNASFNWISDPDGVAFTHSLNLYGFRDRDWTVHTDKERVFFVGDSFTEGMMADDAHQFSDAFLAASREGGRDLDVMNLGISATDMTEYLQVIRDATPIFHPDHIILTLFSNDLPADPYDPELFQMPLQPEWIPWWKPRTLQVIQWLQAGHKPPFRWKSSPFMFIAPVPHPSNIWTAQGEKFDAFVDEDIATAMRQARFNPFEVDEVNRIPRKLQRPIGPAMAQLRDLVDYLKPFGTRLHVVYLPTRHLVSDAYLPHAQRFSNPPSFDAPPLTGAYENQPKALGNMLSKLEVPYYNLIEDFRKAEGEGKRLYWNYDTHMNDVGYQFTGEQIYSWWAQSVPE